jgi:hypothetical protein
MIAERRRELRVAAKSQIEAPDRQAVLKIKMGGVDAQPRSPSRG